MSVQSQVVGLKKPPISLLDIEVGEHLALATEGGASTTISSGGATGMSTEATELFSDMITKIVISPTFPGDVIAGGRGDGWRPWVLLIGLFCLSRKNKQIRNLLLRTVFLEKKTGYANAKISKHPDLRSHFVCNRVLQFR